MMGTRKVIEVASGHLRNLSGHVFDVLTLGRPASVGAAVNLAKVISKLSPLVGNLIEFNAVDYLNTREEFKPFGVWRRQDPGFPDTIFDGKIEPQPGFEIKAWFPLATEITARFRDSQNHFKDDRTYVALLAWLPDSLVYGQPRILDVCVVSGRSVAEARDTHYHNPPDYLVLEPEDTAARTANLQQTNTNGYKFQGTSEQFQEAQRIVNSWGQEGRAYKPIRGYQRQLRELFGRFPYRLDTNFAKIDRIVHEEIEAFKSRVLEREVFGKKVKQWSELLGSEEEAKIEEALRLLYR